MDLFMESLNTAGAIIFVFFALGFCIFSHELGHFLAAKWRGLHVDAFSLGFKPFWRKKYRGVEYRLGYLPFGGYVELPQVDGTGDIPVAADGTKLPKASPLDRVITAVAGPLFNVISGLIIGCIVWWAGLPQDSPKMREIQVLKVTNPSPEYAAGLRPGDKIVKLNGQPFFDTWMVFVKKILFTINKVELEIVRNGKTLIISYTPEINAQAPGSMKSEKLAYPFFTPLIPLALFPQPDSPAAKGGIMAGDILESFNGKPVFDYYEFQNMINFSGSNPVNLVVKRGDKSLTLTVIPRPVPVASADFDRYLIGIIMRVDSASKVEVVDVTAGSAQQAGVLPGDRLVAANEIKLDKIWRINEFLQQHQNKPFTLTVERQGKLLKFNLSARKVTPHEIGVSIAVYDHPTPWHQFMDTVDMSWKSLRGIAVGIGNKLHLTKDNSSIKPSHMSGPLGIGMVLFTSVKTSPIYGIYFMVVISFALALFNLMPFPVLDGGHVLFGILEIIFRRPLPRTIIKGLSMVFVALLVGLMLFVTWSDGRRLYNKIQQEFQGAENGTPSEQP